MSEMSTPASLQSALQQIQRQQQESLHGLDALQRQHREWQQGVAELLAVVSKLEADGPKHDTHYTGTASDCAPPNQQTQHTQLRVSTESLLSSAGQTDANSRPSEGQGTEYPQQNNPPKLQLQKTTSAGRLRTLRETTMARLPILLAEVLRDQEATSKEFSELTRWQRIQGTLARIVDSLAFEYLTGGIIFANMDCDRSWSRDGFVGSWHYLGDRNWKIISGDLHIRTFAANLCRGIWHFQVCMELPGFVSGCRGYHRAYCRPLTRILTWRWMGACFDRERATFAEIGSCFTDTSPAPNCLAFCFRIVVSLGHNGLNDGFDSSLALHFWLCCHWNNHKWSTTARQYWYSSHHWHPFWQRATCNIDFASIRHYGCQLPKCTSLWWLKNRSWLFTSSLCWCFFPLVWWTSLRLFWLTMPFGSLPSKLKQRGTRKNERSKQPCQVCLTFLTALMLIKAATLRVKRLQVCHSRCFHQRFWRLRQSTVWKICSTCWMEMKVEAWVRSTSWMVYFPCSCMKCRFGHFNCKNVCCPYKRLPIKFQMICNSSNGTTNLSDPAAVQTLPEPSSRRNKRETVLPRPTYLLRQGKKCCFLHCGLPGFGVGGIRKL